MIGWTPALEPRLRECLVPATVLLALVTAIAALSRHFEYGSPMLDRPILPVIVLLILAGLVYLFAAIRIHRLPNNPRFLAALILTGLAMRLIFLFSTPILEDDYYRYLWEGGMVANGYSPYTLPPGAIDLANAPSDLVKLRIESGDVAGRINHDSLSSVYPPVTLGAFTLSHTLAPWSLTGWRILLLLTDTAAFAVLLLILRKLERPLAQSVIYWWNPVLIKETINSAHMDVLVVLFITLALLTLLHHKLIPSGIALALAVATKLWPIILAPFFLRHTRALRPERIRALAVSAVALLILMLPLILALPLSQSSGFTAYSERWEMNDALFMGIHKAAGWTGLQPENAARLARLTAVLLLLLWIFLLQHRPNLRVTDFLNHLVLATGLLFMLSPTQFPWYFIWIIPLLTLSPRMSFLAITVFLPLYYLKFYFDARDNIDLFHNVIVWIEFTPVIGLFLYEVIRFRLKPAEYAGIINA